MRTAILVSLLSLAATTARAEVAAQWDSGFTTRNVVEAPVSATRAYQALGEVGRWWNGAHSYSGDAKNLSIDLKAGGCFCEALPGGGVQHGVVVLAWPAQGMVRIDGALGPLQEQGVTGALTFTIKPKGAGAVTIEQTYTVSGRPGVAKPFAAIVDQVVNEQLQRLARYLSTGKP